MSEEFQGETREHIVAPQAPTSRYLEMVYPADKHQYVHTLLPPYAGMHLLHMLAMSPGSADDVASHLGLGPAAARETLDQYVDTGLVIETAGLYSTTVTGVLNVLAELWPKTRQQQNLVNRDEEWDCRRCLLPGER